MPNFSVPNQINPGDALDANKAMANWNQVVNDLNGAKIDATNTAVSFAKDVVEPAFSGWKPLWVGGVAHWLPTASNLNVADAPSSISTFAVPRHLDPTDVAAGSRTVQWRIKASVYTNQVAPAVTLTAFLGPATATYGASGSPNTYGIPSFTCRADFVAPAASSNLHVEGTAVTAAVGHYMLAVTASGAAAAGAEVDAHVVLEYRQT